MNPPGSPAAQLEGLSLDGGWMVVQRVERGPAATGGCFSHSYLAIGPNGQEGFVKALDYGAAMQAPDPAIALQELTAAFLHERSLLDKCARSRTTHVVLALGSGQVDVPGFGPISRVQYLIFERAVHDVRTHLDTLPEFDLA